MIEQLPAPALSVAMVQLPPSPSETTTDPLGVVAPSDTVTL